MTNYQDKFEELYAIAVLNIKNNHRTEIDWNIQKNIDQIMLKYCLQFPLYNF